MLKLNPSTFQQIVNRAKNAAANEPRWLSAIDRAAQELEMNPYIERDDHGLLIGSPSGQIYSANGVCQCKAFKTGHPCWHRAAARLVQRHDEALARRQVTRAQAEAEMAELFN